MNPISVISAKHIDNYMLGILFDNNEVKRVDFGTFLNTHSHPQYDRCKNEEDFKQFKIENGNVVWGDEWDMIFPVWGLYSNKIEA
ncbi:MAG: DUF2442 domain-containing protein [Edaphocola sp.]